MFRALCLLLLGPAATLAQTSPQDIASIVAEWRHDKHRLLNPLIDNEGRVPRARVLRERTPTQAHLHPEAARFLVDGANIPNVYVDYS